MSFRNSFERLFEEFELLNAASNALATRRFEKPKIIIALSEIVKNTRERIRLIASALNRSIDELIELYNKRYNVMKFRRARYVKQLNQKRAELRAITASQASD